MPIRPILLLGNPDLYRRSAVVESGELGTIPQLVTDLHDTMMAFRDRYGCGRAIAAPQIGIFRRVIYMHIDKPVVLINPELVNLSGESMELWDDCMSFPDLLVRVQRHRSCTIRYTDLSGAACSMDLRNDLSELLQHEYDHLDGILATQRAIDDCSFALRSEVSSQRRQQGV
jgi:peptide deformylase